MPGPKPAYKLFTLVDAPISPSSSKRAREWWRWLGPLRMDAYGRMRRLAVTERAGVLVSRRRLIEELIKCHPRSFDWRLDELATAGLVEVERAFMGVTIYVKPLPKKMPKSPLLPRQRHDAVPNEVLAEYVRRGKEYLGVPPHINRGKDHSLAGKLLDQYAFKDLSLLIWNYFEDVSKGVYKGASFGHFFSQIDVLIQKRGGYWPKDAGDPAAKAAADAKYEADKLARNTKELKRLLADTKMRQSEREYLIEGVYLDSPTLRPRKKKAKKKQRTQ